jgi:inner membrane protein
MKQSTASGKLIAMVLIGGLCFIASMMVLGLVAEREGREREAKQEIGSTWGNPQTIVGPMLVFPVLRNGIKENLYVLPSKLTVESTLDPEVRARGIFKTTLYTSTLKVSGEFRGSDIKEATAIPKDVTLSVFASDTRGIENQVDLLWGGTTKAFEPGAGLQFTDYKLQSSSGIHTTVVADPYKDSIPFSFEVKLKGSESFVVAPVGEESQISIQSPWKTPKFTGPSLPSERTLADTGFTSEWRSSSFGRTYPQVWTEGLVNTASLAESAVGVELHESVDTYDLVSRSVKYALLFIALTFGVFFLFDVLSRVRIHPVQYLLIGSALALFYLLLLSLSEHIGFFNAYLLGAVMIVGLVSAYSVAILKSVRRALPIFAFLSLLYGYLYFVLQLEDFALLFGSLLLFVFIAIAMYMTRKIDWYSIEETA